MTSKAIYTPEGVVLTINGASEGLNLVISDTMLISAIESHVRELVEWLS